MYSRPEEMMLNLKNSATLLMNIFISQ